MKSESEHLDAMTGWKMDIINAREELVGEKGSIRDLSTSSVILTVVPYFPEGFGRSTLVAMDNEMNAKKTSLPKEIERFRKGILEMGGAFKLG